MSVTPMAHVGVQAKFPTETHVAVAGREEQSDHRVTTRCVRIRQETLIPGTDCLILHYCLEASDALRQTL